jgi:hypothetical protein
MFNTDTQTTIRFLIIMSSSPSHSSPSAAANAFPVGGEASPLASHPPQPLRRAILKPKKKSKKARKTDDDESESSSSSSSSSDDDDDNDGDTHMASRNDAEPVSHVTTPTTTRNDSGFSSRLTTTTTTTTTAAAATAAPSHNDDSARAIARALADYTRDRDITAPALRVFEKRLEQLELLQLAAQGSLQQDLVQLRAMVERLRPTAPTLRRVAPHSAASSPYADAKRPIGGGRVDLRRYTGKLKSEMPLQVSPAQYLRQSVQVLSIDMTPAQVAACLAQMPADDAFFKQEMIDLIASRHDAIDTRLDLDELVEEIIKRFLDSGNDLRLRQQLLQEARSLQQKPSQQFRDFQHKKKLQLSKSGVQPAELDAYAPNLFASATPELRSSAATGVGTQLLWIDLQLTANTRQLTDLDTDVSLSLPEEQRKKLVLQQRETRALLTRRRHELLFTRKVALDYSVETLARDTTKHAWHRVSDLLSNAARHLAQSATLKRKAPASTPAASTRRRPQPSRDSRRGPTPVQCQNCGKHHMKRTCTQCFRCKQYMFDCTCTSGFNLFAGSGGMNARFRALQDELRAQVARRRSVEAKRKSSQRNLHAMTLGVDVPATTMISGVSTIPQLTASQQHAQRIMTLEHTRIKREQERLLKQEADAIQNKMNQSPYSSSDVIFPKAHDVLLDYPEPARVFGTIAPGMEQHRNATRRRLKDFRTLCALRIDELEQAPPTHDAAKQLPRLKERLHARVYVPVLIDDEHPLECLLDTGAELTGISATTAHKLGCTLRQIQPVPLAMANKSAVVIRQVALISMQIGRTRRVIEAAVIPDLAEGLILGIDDILLFGLVRFTLPANYPTGREPNRACQPPTARATDTARKASTSSSSATAAATAAETKTSSVPQTEDDAAVPGPDPMPQDESPAVLPLDEQREKQRREAYLEKVDDKQRAWLLTQIADELSTNEALDPHQLCTHPAALTKIDTKGATPVSSRRHCIPLKYREKVQQQITAWLVGGQIEHGDPGSRWRIPLLAVPKPPDSIRLCGDFRAVNELIDDDAFLVPKIPELIEDIRGFKIASALDLRQSYTQMPLRQQDRKKTSFSFGNTTYQFRGCPFGLRHMTSHFQRAMEIILAPARHCVRIYIDDIVVFSQSLEEHAAHLKLVMSLLSKWHLRLNAKKCHFGFQTLNLFGMCVSGTETWIADAKLRKCIEYPKKFESCKQLSAFLGFANFLRAHIPHYARLAAPLERLRNIKSKKQFAALWNDTHERAVKTLQLAIAENVRLRPPQRDPTTGKYARLVLATDASKFGLGAALYNETVDAEGERSRSYIGFYAKSLNAAQRNYSATKREMLAIVWALQQTRPYWYGTDFDLYTDHMALCYLFTQETVNSTALNWMETLLEASPRIHHVPGPENLVPDSLSRLYIDTFAKNEQPRKVPSALAQHDELHTNERLRARALQFKQQLKSQATLIQTLKTRLAAAVPARIAAMTKSTPALDWLAKHGAAADIRDGLAFAEPPVASPSEQEMKHTAPTSASVPVLSAELEQKHTEPPAPHAAEQLRYDSEVDARREAARRRLLQQHDIESNYDAAASLSTAEQIKLAQTFIDKALGNRGVGGFRLNETPLSSRDLNEFLRHRADKTAPASTVEREALLIRTHHLNHQGQASLFKTLWNEGYFWPEMRRDCAAIVAHCAACTRMNVARHGFNPVRSIHATFPMDHVAVDLCKPGASIPGRILVLVCVATKYVVLRYIKDKTTKAVCESLLQILGDYGPFKILQSDVGPEFVSQVMTALKRLLNFDHRITNAYNPAANGLAEAGVKRVKALLGKWGVFDSPNLPAHLALAQLALNRRQHRTINSSPFALMHCRPANPFADFSSVESRLQSPERRKEFLSRMHDIVYATNRERVEREAKRDAARRNDSRPTAKPFEIGSLVYIRDMLVNHRVKSAATPTYVGPYMVQQKTRNKNAYILTDSRGFVFAHAVKPQHMKRYLSKKLIKQYTAPVSGSVSWRMERILRYALAPDNSRYFLIKWSDYDINEATWEPERHIEDKESIAIFFKSKPTPRAATLPDFVFIRDQLRRHKKTPPSSDPTKTSTPTSTLGPRRDGGFPPSSRPLKRARGSLSSSESKHVPQQQQLFVVPEAKLVQTQQQQQKQKQQK